MFDGETAAQPFPICPVTLGKDLSVRDIIRTGAAPLAKISTMTQVPAETLAWLDEATQDIPAWAAVMPKDADNRPIDWQWVAGLDLISGVGAARDLDFSAPLDESVDIVSLLRADYATRRALEGILSMTVRTFMGDFERAIASFRLPRALAYANRRLNDEIALLIEAGKRRELWNVETRSSGGTTVPVLSPAGAWPQGQPMHDIQDQSLHINEERRAISKEQRDQQAAAARDTSRATTQAPVQHGNSEWRRTYLPGRAVDTVLGIDLETTGINPWRSYIIDAGFERMNMRSTLPLDAVQSAIYTEPYYAFEDAYDQARLQFGVPRRCALADHTFIRELTGIDVNSLADNGMLPFDEWPAAQRSLLRRLTEQPYVAHNATFEHKYFQFNVEGYAEAYRDGHIVIIDTLPMSQYWDKGSVPSEDHPHGDNTLDAYAKRQGALPEDHNERHLGLEDAHIMLVAMKHHLDELKAESGGPWGAQGRFGIGGKQCRTRH